MYIHAVNKRRVLGFSCLVRVTAYFSKASLVHAWSLASLSPSQLKKSRLLSCYSKSYTTAGLLSRAALINTLRPPAAENPCFCLRAHAQRVFIICCDRPSFAASASQRLTRPLKPPVPLSVLTPGLPQECVHAVISQAPLTWVQEFIVFSLQP